MNIVVSDSFFPLFGIKARYLFLEGGAGSGKSEFTARKLFRRAEEEGGHRFLVMRKVRKTLKDSVIKVFTVLLEANGIAYEYNKSDRYITIFNPAGRRSEFLFDGMDDWQKIKSIKGVTGVWLEETTEFSEEEFHQVDLYLREPTPYYKQIICTYNPDERQAPWLKKLKAAKKDKDVKYFWHESTIEDNPIPEVRKEYMEVLDALDDLVLREIYRYGRWALPKGLIFKWDEADPPVVFDEVIYGGDFGYSINEAAFVRIYRKALEFWVEDLIYETGLTNPMLAARIKGEPGVNPRTPSYWDSAEPKSIQELCDRGVNALPCKKFAGFVEASIKLLQSLKIHIVRGSVHIPEEQRTYKWKVDKFGKPVVPLAPVEYNDHAMKAVAYGICEHYWTYLRPGRRKGRVRHGGMAVKVEIAQQTEDWRAKEVKAHIERMNKFPADRDAREQSAEVQPEPATQTIQPKGGEHGRKKGRVYYTR